MMLAAKTRCSSTGHRTASCPPTVTRECSMTSIYLPTYCRWAAIGDRDTRQSLSSVPRPSIFLCAVRRQGRLIGKLARDHPPTPQPARPSPKRRFRQDCGWWHT